MPAPEGNRNATKEAKGIQVNFYLDAQDAKAIRDKLIAQGEESDDKEIRRYARELSKNGIALELNGKCSVDGCIWAVEVECSIGACAPLTRYCTYHYGQSHLPDDEHECGHSSVW